MERAQPRSRRVIEIARFGAPEVLRIREEAALAPGPGEVAVEVRALGLNFADIMGRLGLYGPAPKAPYIPGFEVAGVVAQVGSGVTTFAPGDRVIAGSRFGAYTTRLTTAASRVMPLPGDWSFAEGAGFLATYATAYHALVTLGRVGAGARVLIHAGAGGLGTAAIQLARHLGARVVATAGGADKARFCEEQGADVGVDYLEPHWPSRVRAAAGARPGSDGTGLDFVLDSVLGPTLAPSLELLAPMGHLVLCGAASFTPRSGRNWLTLGWEWLKMPRIDPLAFIPTNRSLSGFNLLLLWEDEAYMTMVAARLLELAAGGVVRPVIGHTYPFDDVVAAHIALQGRRTRGKVVLLVDEPSAR